MKDQAMTKNDGPIEFKRGVFKCKLVSQAYAELAGPCDATAEDIIAALLANPEVRMQVLEQMPEYANGPTEAAFAELEKRAEAAEAELRALAWLVVTPPHSQTGDHVDKLKTAACAALTRLAQQPPPEARKEDSGVSPETTSMNASRAVTEAAKPSRVGAGATEPPAVEPAPHQLNEHTWCERCGRFDPPGPCPGEPAVAPPPAEPASGEAERDLDWMCAWFLPSAFSQSDYHPVREFFRAIIDITHECGTPEATREAYALAMLGTFRRLRLCIEERGYPCPAEQFHAAIGSGYACPDCGWQPEPRYASQATLRASPPAEPVSGGAERVSQEVGSAEYWHERFSRCLEMLGATQRQNEQSERELTELRAQLSEAEKATAELRAQLDQVCGVLYNTGATRGDALTRAKRANETYHRLINEQVSLEEERDALKTENEKLRAERDALKRAATEACAEFRAYVADTSDKDMLRWIGLCDAISALDGNPAPGAPLEGILGGDYPEQSPTSDSPVKPSDFVTRAELVEAARRASHAGYLDDSAQNALHAFAEALEKGAGK